MNKKKALQDPGPNTHTAATIRKEVLTPPPKKRETQVQGGRGSNSKNHCWVIFDPKMMILQVVRRQKRWGMLCEGPQKREGHRDWADPPTHLSDTLKGGGVTEQFSKKISPFSLYMVLDAEFVRYAQCPSGQSHQPSSGKCWFNSY